MSGHFDLAYEPGTELIESCEPEETGASVLPDHIREFWIRWFGRRMERSMALYEETGCFGHRGEADAWRMRMEALIKGRSAAQVTRMNAERGLL